MSVNHPICGSANIPISVCETRENAHAEMFSEISPATSMVELNRLISSELLVEIETTAIITSDSVIKTAKTSYDR